MKELPKVSIGIITYNQADFIEEAVLSALHQDYPNIEVVVSDDGSSDETPEILQKLLRDYPDRLKLILLEKNVGLAQNCNVALSECDGEYLCFMGGDDILAPGKIKHQLEFMLCHPECSVSYHQVEAFESSSRKHLYFFTTHFIEGYSKDLIENGMFFLPIGAMAKMTQSRQVKFREEIPIASDWYFFIDILRSSSGSILYFPGVYAYYRRHSNNVTNFSNNADNWNAVELMRKEMPDLRESIDRFQARLALMEWRSKRISLQKMLPLILKSPRASIWALNWLLEARQGRASQASRYITQLMKRLPQILKG
ncbi:glycosyltransferase family 2 protein [Deinococcus maricopensis]|uniref:Glycosyl transferase family 2 n=1 Tax=Deinococcus maricopensis (strain DSM 21211 / LMG 22137 / NRRL B-23946 / LB-34) TaxID=709986 RepID=E8U3I4_DEIML|nr:glycosyltransferase family 2 protein [Deinococcus maricopensis]ADV68608.1 glycosyl transferase family 2 [Deinococcus maricopensis DSM 21211]